MCSLGIDLKCKSKIKAVESVQQVKVLASKLDSLGYTLRFHTVGEDKPGQVILDTPSRLIHTSF